MAKKTTFPPSGPLSEPLDAKLEVGGPAAQSKKSRMANPTNALSTIQTASKRLEFQIEQDRMVIDACDRMPPIDPAELEKTGELWRTNVDHGDTEVAIVEKTEQLNNLAVLPLPLITFKTRDWDIHPSATDNLTKVGLEYDYLLTESDFWVFEIQKMCFNMGSTGLGILHFPEPNDWTFESQPRCNLIYPVRAGLNPSKWKWMAIRKNISIVELIAKLDPDCEEEVKKLGWKLDSIRKLLKNCKEWKATGVTAASIDQDPEAWVNALLENDLAFASDNNDDIKGFSLYVQEYNGKITEHLLVDDKEIGYIYDSAEEYDSMTDFITLFPLSLGQGYLEKVRGLGHRILPHNAVINDMTNRSVDLSILCGGLKLKGTKEDTLRNVNQLMFGGLVTMIPEDMSLDQKSFGNPAGDLLTMAQVIRDQREANKRVFGGANAGRQEEITATHAKLKYNEDTKGAGYETDRFYKQMTLHHRAVWRRLQYFAKEDEGAVPCGGKKAALNFWKELKDAGVTEEDLKVIRSVHANSLFGDGDPNQVFMALQDIGPMMPSLPISAQRQYMKMMIAARTRKPYLAEEWLPSQSKPDREQSKQDWRTSVEQDGFENGSPMPVQEDDITTIHATNHTAWAEGVLENYNNNVLSPADALKRLILVRDHTDYHMVLLAKSRSDKALLADLGTRWKNIMNMMRRMEQQVKDQQQAEQARQLEELRNPSLSVADRETQMTEEFKRAQIAQTEAAKRQEEAATQRHRRDVMSQAALTGIQLKAISSAPDITEKDG